ncbi:hypothetical protein HDU96_006577 [Phlyctochytrium bullatum]|nr:hypothetical protein HDU96_006577 [Phlyctochytrium bullatum]
MGRSGLLSFVLLILVIGCIPRITAISTRTIKSPFGRKFVAAAAAFRKPGAPPLEDPGPDFSLLVGGPGSITKDTIERRLQKIDDIVRANARKSFFAPTSFAEMLAKEERASTIASGIRSQEHDRASGFTSSDFDATGEEFDEEYVKTADKSKKASKGTGISRAKVTPSKRLAEVPKVNRTVLQTEKKNSAPANDKTDSIVGTDDPIDELDGKHVKPKKVRQLRTSGAVGSHVMAARPSRGAVASEESSLLNQVQLADEAVEAESIFMPPHTPGPFATRRKRFRRIHINVETIETTILDYDIKKVKELLQQSLIAIAVMLYLHLQLGYLRPVILQVAFALRTLSMSPLFKVHILGKPAMNDLTRPWKNPMFSRPTPPPPTPKELKAIEKKLAKKKLNRND